MIPAAIYARFSSELQDARSIADQIALCKTYAERNGYRIVATYEDREISGAVLQARTGYQNLLRDVVTGQFKAVIAESLSRIGRDQEHRAALLKRLNFAGVKLVTPSDGVVSSLVNGVRAIIDAQYLDDLKVMVRRGMAGVIREGRHAGGRSYGYRPTTVRGVLEIVEGEAEIVRRIFDEFLSGYLPRDIAKRLNAERIPAPRGTFWRANTIAGHGRRGSGILRNELYAGTLVWNRVGMLRNPDTEKRISRVNATMDWQRVEVPSLAIIDRKTFDAAQERLRERSKDQPRDRVRVTRMLTGLLRCGCCGAGMPSLGTDGHGPRIQCAAVREGSACDHTRKYRLARIETAVVGGLKTHLGSSQAIRLYVSSYNAARAKRLSNSDGERKRLNARLKSVEAEIDRAVTLAMKGILREEEAAERLPALRSERDTLTAELAMLQDSPPLVPSMVDIDAYLAELDDLAGAINRRIVEGLPSTAAQRIREIVSRVTVMPAPALIAPTIRIEGYLESLLARSGGRAVAGGRLSQHPRPDFIFEVAA